VKKNISIRIFRRSVILLLVTFFNVVAGIAAKKAAPPVPDILNCEMAQVSVYNTGDEARWWMGWVQADNNLPTQHFVYGSVTGWVEAHEWVTITVYFGDIPYCPDTNGMVARISTFDELHGSRIDDTRLEKALHCSCPTTPTVTPTPTATDTAAPPVPDILNCEMAQVSVYNTGDEARWWMGWVQADNNLPTQHFVYGSVTGWVEAHEWVTITVYFGDIPYCPDTNGMVARISTFDELHGSRIDDTRLEKALHCSCPTTPTVTPTPTATDTSTPTNTPVSSNTPPATNTSVVTNTPSSPLDTPTPTKTLAGTESPTLTETPTPTDTSTVTQIPTITTSLTLTLTHTPVTTQVSDSGLTMLKTVDDDDVVVGDEVTFTLILTNNIDQTVNNVIVTDPIPSFFDIVSATSTKGRVAIDESVNTISLKIQKLKPHEVITITIAARVNDTATFKSEVSNTANLTYSIDDSVSSESSNTVSLLIMGESGMLGSAFRSLASIVDVMSGLFGTFICGYGIWMRRLHAGKGLRYIVAGLILLLLSVGLYYAVVTPFS